MSKAVDLNQFTPKQQVLVRELPKHGYSFWKAGKAAGYSNVYAERSLKKQCLKNTELCRAIEQTRHKVTVSSLNEVEKDKQRLDNIIDDGVTSCANRLKALDMKFKIAGVYSEKRVIEQTSRLAELDDAETQQAQLIAGVLLNLPCPAYEPQHIVGDVEGSVRHTPPLIDGKTGETVE